MQRFILQPASVPRPFRPEERPLFPGSPYSPLHPPARRVLFAVAGILFGVIVNLGNGLVIANVPVLAGAATDYVPSVALLTGVYIAFNASANLVLVKARTQLGIPRVTLMLLSSYAFAAVLLWLRPGLSTALVLAAASGMSAAGLTTLSVYYCMQSLPAAVKPLGLILGIGAVQLGAPLARLFPVDLFSLDGWLSLGLLQLAIAMAAIAIILGYPLPPSERSKAFEPLDGATFALFLVANLCLCTVLAEGRLLWWSDTPWLGWALAACVPCYAGALLIESLRAHPLLQLRWYGTKVIATFAAVAVVVRLALSEQAYGAVGLLSFAGLDNDQFHTLYLWILGGQILGIAVAALTTRIGTQPYQVMVAALIIALAAWLDSGSNTLTRPDNILMTQAMIAFGTTLFIGPALVYGAMEMLKKGSDHLVSLVVLFSMTQNIGGLAGSALLGSYQVVQAKSHAGALADGLAVGNPIVAARIQQGAGALAGVIQDPAQRAAQGAGLLGDALAGQAAVLGFNDAFMLVSLVAISAALFLAIVIVRLRIAKGRSARKGVPQ
ncbi:MFS transporter [Sphingomonas sp. M1-B02]|uniref:MFS transporter n=1 Tax=Sphingomonas sp. M1-B02 TaxID=3114300 RepID=UPI00223FE3DA|nr:MFS transporter [Sphingomonas sp. S6-11]UZK66310.1 MFS transporter [Sphingomonas sp. S6-11]